MSKTSRFCFEPAYTVVSPPKEPPKSDRDEAYYAALLAHINARPAPKEKE